MPSSSNEKNKFDVAIIMGSVSDWPTMKAAEDVLNQLGVSNRALVVSAHRTPKRLDEFATRAREQGYKVIIAGAGGAAHLPGMTAAYTPLPVLGVPCPSTTHPLNDDAAIKSMLMMPKGIPVGTLMVGVTGAINAALLAAAIIALFRPEVAQALDRYRKTQTDSVPWEPESRKE